MEPRVKRQPRNKKEIGFRVNFFAVCFAVFSGLKVVATTFFARIDNLKYGWQKGWMSQYAQVAFCWEIIFFLYLDLSFLVKPGAALEAYNFPD